MSPRALYAVGELLIVVKLRDLRCKTATVYKL